MQKHQAHLNWSALNVLQTKPPSGVCRQVRSNRRVEGFTCAKALAFYIEPTQGASSSALQYLYRCKSSQAVALAGSTDEEFWKRLQGRGEVANAFDGAS